MKKVIVFGLVVGVILSVTVTALFVIVMPSFVTSRGGVNSEGVTPTTSEAGFKPSDTTPAVKTESHPVVKSSDQPEKMAPDTPDEIQVSLADAKDALLKSGFTSRNPTTQSDGGIVYSYEKDAMYYAVSSIKDKVAAIMLAIITDEIKAPNMAEFKRTAITLVRVVTTKEMPAEYAEAIDARKDYFGVIGNYVVSVEEKKPEGRYQLGLMYASPQKRKALIK